MTIGHDIVDKLLNGFVRAASASVFVVLFFTLQYIFDMKFQCSCRAGVHVNGVLFLVAPSLILTWVFLYIETFHRKRSWICNLCKCYSNCCDNIFFIIGKLIVVGGVWIVAVLFDGDWYVCLKTNLNSNYTGMPCKDQTSLTDDEKQFKNDKKIESLEIGLYLLCSLFVGRTLFASLGFCCSRLRRCTSSCNRDKDLCCPPYYEVLYEHFLEEEFSNHLEEELSKLAKEKAKDNCLPYLQIIKENDKNGGNKAKEAWRKISMSDFYLSQKSQEDHSQPHSRGSEQEDSQPQSGSEQEDSQPQSGSGQEDSQPQSGSEQEDLQPQSGSEQGDSQPQNGSEQEDSQPQSGSGQEDSQPQSGSEQEDSQPLSGSEQGDSQPQNGSEQEDSQPQSGSGQEDSQPQSGSEQEDSQPQSGSGQEDSQPQSGSEQEDSQPQSGSGQEDSQPQSGSEQEDSQPLSGSEQGDSQPQSGSEQEDSQPLSGSGQGDLQPQSK
ncbi:unnamed protein product [Knipowitschia caucasica]